MLADILDRASDDHSALAEQARAEELAISTITQLDRMAELIRECEAGRVSATLDRLSADGRLSSHDRARLAADEAFGSLERLLRTAELAGHDPERVLATAVSARGFDDAASPAQVLHHRITTRLEGRLTPRIRTGAADLIPHHLRDADTTDGPEAVWGTALRRLADAADNRRHELGARTAEEAPAWAIDALGPVPTGADAASVVARQEWEHRAGWAAAYRELVGHTDEHDALGAAPGAGRVEHRLMFRAAHDALALAEAGDEEAGMTDGRLRARVAGYERERAWAPRWVEDELAATHERRARLDADATLWTARADAPDMASDEAERLRTDAARARAEAEHLAGQIVDLEKADSAWAEWYAHTAVSRDLADRARHELRARGVDLDSPPDRTTAQEWLDAHRAAQAEHERHAEITEADVPADDSREAVAGRADRRRPVDVETDVVDIRDSSTPDPTEHADPAERRRVPTLDETTKTVHAAQTALAEIAARREAEAAAEAARAAEEDERMAELHRWSADGDRVADDGRDPAADVEQYADNDAVLER